MGHDIPIGSDIDTLLDEMEPASFTAAPTGRTIRVGRVEGALIEFHGHLRAFKTPRGRQLVPVEDVVGLLDAQIEVDGSLEDTRRFLVNAAMGEETT